MSKLKDRQEYWKKGKLYRVLRDDTVSLFLLYYFCWTS